MTAPESANRFQILIDWLADQINILASQNETRSYWLMEETLREISITCREMADTAALLGVSRAAVEEA